MTTVEQSRWNSEVTAAGHTDQAETAPLILCPACRAEARKRDRFCRQCGARQCAHNMESSARATSQNDARSTPATSPLAPASDFHRVSGSLVAAVANGALANTANYPIHRVTRKVIAILISIPIWLVIVLLSPLDAYIAARAVSRQS